MPTHAVFPDGIPKGVLEAEDFDKDVNPLTLLSHLEEVLSAHLPTLEDSSLITLSKGSLHEELQLDISKTDTSLKSSAKYVMTFMDTLSALSQMLATVRQKLTNKLDKEFVNFIPGERKMTEEELRILQQNTQVHKDFADRAAEMAALEKLADQIQEATVLLGQEVLCVREEAEQARAALEEAEKQAELQKREASERKEREEAARRAKEEQKRKEELDAQRRREKESRRTPEEAGNEREEERMQREREEQARNPANWTPFVYNVSEEEDVTGTGLGCVLRVPPGNIEQTDVNIKVVDQLNSTFSLGENEELVSNLIHIEVNEGAIYEFPYPPWLAISNCSPRGLSAREVVIRICSDGKTWTELPTKDAKLHDSPELRLVEGPFTTLCNMEVCAVSKLKIDQEKVSNRGTKVVSSVDSRFSIVIPKGAVRLSTEVSLQVQPVDSTVVGHVKDQVESMAPLVASSHLVSIQAQCKFLKPVTIWMPSPGSSRRPKTGVTPIGQKKTPTQQRPSTAGSRHKEEKETVVLAWKRGQSDWQYASGETLTETRDLVSFNLNISQMPIRLLLLRAKQDVSQSLNVADAAKNVEQAVKGKCVNVALRQRSDDMSSVYIEISKSDKTEKLLQALATKGLDSGPQPSDDFLLTEGQVVEVRFRGNVTNDDEEVIRFPYNSNLESTRCHLFIKEVDRFAQHGLDCYRGHIQFLTVAPPPPKTNKTPKVDNETASEDICPPEPTPMKLLTELAIALPKAPIRPPTLNRITVQFEEQGPLTKEYFESLSTDLGDEWRQLAEFLGVKPARVESIKREYLESDNKEKVVQDVLLNWYKQTSRNGDKVGELYWALRDTGRLDLSEELLDKNDTFQKQSEMRKENDKMQKAFKLVTESAAALKEWQLLARELRLSEANIEQLAQNENSSLREQCYQMLQLWRKTSGQKATRKSLARALKACKFLEPAEKIKQMR